MRKGQGASQNHLSSRLPDSEEDRRLPRYAEVGGGGALK